MLYDYFTIFLHYLSTTRESNTPFAQIKSSPKAAYTLTVSMSLLCRILNARQNYIHRIVAYTFLNIYENILPVSAKY